MAGERADELESPIELDSLIERVAALKHDLGKYVAWTSANLDDRVWTGPLVDELIDALRADLLETRKSSSRPSGPELGDRRETAWEVWAAHRAGLPDPLEPELEVVAAGVAVLERIGSSLRQPAGGERLGEEQRDAIARERANIRAAQQDIRNGLRDLHRRLLRER